MRGNVSSKNQRAGSAFSSATLRGAAVLLTFLFAAAGLVSWLVGHAQAQQKPAGTVYRVGFLSQGQPPKAYFEALQQGLREHGYAEGRNLVWELRSTDGGLDQLSRFADELVRLNVDLILARASSGAMAAKRATTSIPIVFFAVYAPVEIGLVPNLGHPGGNITGVAVNASDMAAKRVQLLKDLVPTLKRVAMLSHPPHPTNAVQVQGAEAAARTVGVQLEAVPVRGADDFASALKALRGIEGVLHADTPLFVNNRARLVNAGQDLEGCKAGRSSCRATHDVRVGDQQQDGESHRSDDSAVTRVTSGPDRRMTV
jgi:putative tryptophan/tyrosine transport system substrate-binding protein